MTELSRSWECYPCYSTEDPPSFRLGLVPVSYWQFAAAVDRFAFYDAEGRVTARDYAP
jgi:hypothetical protein